MTPGRTGGLQCSDGALTANCMVRMIIIVTLSDGQQLRMRDADQGTMRMQSCFAPELLQQQTAQPEEASGGEQIICYFSFPSIYTGARNPRRLFLLAVAPRDSAKQSPSRQRDPPRQGISLAPQQR